MNKKTFKRVAVTGLGIIASIGESLPEFSKGLFQGECGIGPISVFDPQDFPIKLAAQVKNDDLTTSFEPEEVKRISRCDLLGLIAAREAILNWGTDLDQRDGNRIGVVLGGGAGGMLSWEKYRRMLWLKDRKPRPAPLLAAAPCTLTDLIAWRYKLTGYRSTVVTACSSSGTAIGYGFDLIRSGTQDVIVTGGSESLAELTFGGFTSLRAVSPTYCRPFDKNRQGLSLGEGAAILILEDYDQARDRGAIIYAEVLGYAINSDAYHMTAPDPKGRGMSRVMAHALNNCNLDPHEVDYINAHGTGTPLNDVTETRAIKKVFGEKHAGNLAVSSTKSMVGHCLGACGAVEAVTTVLSLYEQLAPPTIHLENPDPDCDLDYVPNNARDMVMNVAISNSFAFGGNNTSLVFRKADVKES